MGKRGVRKKRGGKRLTQEEGGYRERGKGEGNWSDDIVYDSEQEWVVELKEEGRLKERCAACRCGKQVEVRKGAGSRTHENKTGHVSLDTRKPGE